jgi:N-acetyl-anhydromuramyl-L-alanine amidase AmpD
VVAWNRAKACATVTLVGALVACGGEGATGGGEEPAGSLASAFTSSSRDAAVPRDLLVAVAAVEGGLAMPRIRDGLDPSPEVPAAGPLMLRRGKLDTLARGAALVSVTEAALRRDADLALLAGARVLAELGRAHGARAEELASWSAALAELSGYADDAHATAYVHRVYAALAHGGRFAARDGEVVTLPPRDVPPSLALAVDVSETLHPLTAPGAEYPGAVWFPTSCANTKCDTSRGAIDYVVVHDTEGGWDASVATLQNDPGKSVHYIVDRDGKVGQFLHEDVTAYHAGNYYYNQHSVGIEHVGYATQTYPEAQYAASAKLVGYLIQKYGVAVDRAHVIGHDQVPNGGVVGESAAACSGPPKTCESGSSYGGADNHRDPGDWEWATFMVRFGGTAKCDDVTSVWNCNAAKSQAFRCNAGKVEVQVCDGTGGCEVKPAGVDDVCHVAPQSGAMSPTSPPAPGSPAASPTSGSPGAPDVAPPSSSGGCTASGRPASTLPSALLVLALAALARRTRRRASAS